MGRSNVFRDAETRPGTDLVAVLGHVGESVTTALGDGCPGHIATRENQLPLGDSGHPRDRGGELGLPVALHPCDPDDFSCLHGEREVVDDPHTPFVDDAEIPDGEHLVAWCRRGVHDAQENLSADHHLCDIGLGEAGCRQRGDRFAVADDGDFVGDLKHFAQFVGDEHDGAALCRQRSHDDEEFVGFAGRQHGGRLVEDKEPRVVAEGLQKFDPLTHTDRQR